MREAGHGGGTTLKYSLTGLQPGRMLETVQSALAFGVPGLRVAGAEALVSQARDSRLEEREMRWQL